MVNFFIKHCCIYLYVPTTIPYSLPTKKGTFQAIFLKDLEQMLFLPYFRGTYTNLGKLGQKFRRKHKEFSVVRVAVYYRVIEKDGRDLKPL